MKKKTVTNARVVVGMFTMGLVEAALLGKPAISVQVGRRGPDALPTNRSGLTRGVIDPKELRDVLAASLEGRLPPPPRAALDAWRPGAADRVIDALDALVRGNDGPT